MDTRTPKSQPSPLLSFAQGWASVTAHASLILQQPSPAQVILSLANARGRVLATPILANRDQPPFDRVTRDGYALRAEDLHAGTPLRVIRQIRAGEAWPADRPALAAGEAVEIMTGAPLPPGANAVLMVEYAEEDSAGRTLRPLPGRSLLPGANVVPRGSEAHAADMLVAPGTLLTAAHIAMAASCGFARLPVYAQPRVAILATGDELVEPGDSNDFIATQKIYNSNSHSTAAMVAQAGAIPLRLPIVPDQKEALVTSIRAALGIISGSAASPDLNKNPALHQDMGADLLLLSGGVSMGKYDLVEEVLADLGAEFFFTGLHLQPGKPLVFGRIPAGEAHPARPANPARYFFGLPGNPISTMVTFALFVRPLLAALAGEQGYQPPFVLARLCEDVRSTQGLTRFLPAWLDRAPGLTGAMGFPVAPGFSVATSLTGAPGFTEVSGVSGQNLISIQSGVDVKNLAKRTVRFGEPTVTPIPWHGSGDLVAIARANCYLVVPEDEPVLTAGTYVRVLLPEL